MIGFIIFVLVVAFLGFFGLFVIMAVFNAFVRIPTAHYGVSQIFGWRSGRIVHEGLRPRIPWIEKFILVPYGMKTTSITLSVPTKDRLEVNITGSVKWRPDLGEQNEATGRRERLDYDNPNHRMRNRILRLIEIPETTITTGLVDAVKNHVGQVAGQHEGTDFITHKGAVHLLITSILMLAELPHQKPEVLLPFLEGQTLNLKSKKMFDQKKKQVHLKKVLDFYQEYDKVIRRYLKAHTSTAVGCSEIEDLYTINIQVFDLADIDFSPATKQAFELETQVAKKVAAQNAKLEAKENMMKALTNMGLSAEQADQISNVMLELAQPKQVVELLGQGAFPIVNISPNQP